MPGSGDDVHMLKAQGIRDGEGRLHLEELGQHRALQVGLDRIVAAIVRREDRVGAMGLAQVPVKLLAQRFEVVVAAVLKVRRDDLVNGRAMGRQELLHPNQHVAVHIGHGAGDGLQRPANDGQRRHQHLPVMAGLTLPGQQIAVASALNRIAKLRDRRDLRCQPFGGVKRLAELIELDPKRIWCGAGPGLGQSGLNLRIGQGDLTGQSMVVKAFRLCARHPFQPGRTVPPELEANDRCHPKQEERRDDQGKKQQAEYEDRNPGQPPKEITKIPHAQSSTTKSSPSSALSLMKSFSCASVSSSRS